MIRCRDCFYFEEDEGMQRCRQGNFGIDTLFGFDSPEESMCDFFRRFQDDDDLMLGIERYDEIELFMHDY